MVNRRNRGATWHSVQRHKPPCTRTGKDCAPSPQTRKRRPPAAFLLRAPVTPCYGIAALRTRCIVAVPATRVGQYTVLPSLETTAEGPVTAGSAILVCT